MSMSFPFGTTVYRLRPKQVWDEYAHDWVLGDWDDPDELEIPGAFVAQTSTSMLQSATREQALESKSLFDPINADIRKGDRIRNGGPGAPVYGIGGIPPEPDTNPWTGWTPPREIPLTRAVG